MKQLLCGKNVKTFLEAETDKVKPTLVNKTKTAITTLTHRRLQEEET